MSSLDVLYEHHLSVPHGCADSQCEHHKRVERSDAKVEVLPPETPILEIYLSPRNALCQWASHTKGSLGSFDGVGQSLILA